MASQRQSPFASACQYLTSPQSWTHDAPAALKSTSSPEHTNDNPPPQNDLSEQSVVNGDEFDRLLGLNGYFDADGNPHPNAHHSYRDCRRGNRQVQEGSSAGFGWQNEGFEINVEGVTEACPDLDEAADQDLFLQPDNQASSRDANADDFDNDHPVSGPGQWHSASNSGFAHPSTNDFLYGSQNSAPENAELDGNVSASEVPLPTSYGAEPSDSQKTTNAIGSGPSSAPPVTLSQRASHAASTSSVSGEFLKQQADRKEHKAREHAFRDKDGNLWHKLNASEEPVLAVRHCDIADQLRSMADNRGSYCYTPEIGETPGDRLSFVPGHVNWGEDRAHRPGVLFQFYKPGKIPAACQPRRWMFQGRRVINHLGKWMWEYDDVPATIPSVIKGWRMEAYMRRNPSLCLEDIQGRMPLEFSATIKGKTRLHGVWDDTTLRNRTMRFRWGACLISWTRRENCEVTKAYFEQLLESADERNNSPQSFKILNSTQVLGRDLNTDEFRELRRRQNAAKQAKKEDKERKNGKQPASSGLAQDSNTYRIANTFPQDLLASEMSPLASPGAQDIDGYGDLEVGNHDTFCDDDEYVEAYRQDSESPRLPWPARISVSRQRQQVSNGSRLDVLSGPHRASGEIETKFSTGGRTNGHDRSEYTGSSNVSQQQLAGNQSTPTQRTKRADTPIISSATYSPRVPKRRHEPAEDDYEGSALRHTSKRPRMEDLGQPYKRLKSNFPDRREEDSLAGRHRALKQQAMDRVAAQPPQVNRQSQSNSAVSVSWTRPGSLQAQAASAAGQKRSANSMERDQDEFIQELPSKRQRYGEMAPPLVSASGRFVGSSWTMQHQGVRRSGQPKPIPPLRKRVLPPNHLSRNEQSHLARPFDQHNWGISAYEQPAQRVPANQVDLSAEGMNQRVQLTFPIGTEIHMLPPNDEYAYATKVSAQGTEWRPIDRAAFKASTQPIKQQGKSSSQATQIDKQPYPPAARSSSPKDGADAVDNSFSGAGCGSHDHASSPAQIQSRDTKAISGANSLPPELQGSAFQDHGRHQGRLHGYPVPEVGSSPPFIGGEAPSDEINYFLGFDFNFGELEPEDPEAIEAFEQVQPVGHPFAMGIFPLDSDETLRASSPRWEGQTLKTVGSADDQSHDNEDEESSGDEHEFFPPEHPISDIRKRYKGMRKLW